jgi:hypothetical protein
VAEGGRKTWRDHIGAFVIALAVAVLTATAAPWWWPAIFGASADDNNPVGVVGFSGGCEAFRVVAQNRWEPYGARKLASPNPVAEKVGSFAPNEVIAVNGWVHSNVAYPTNPPPWNSNVWFHVADGTGWVAFAAVRELPTTPDPTGTSDDGGPPAPTPEHCRGAVR